MENPAFDHYRQALALRIAAIAGGSRHGGVEETRRRAVQEARGAIQLGLIAEDEVDARALVGGELISLSCEDEGVAELEKAVSLDIEGGYGVFLQRGKLQPDLWALQQAYWKRAWAIRGHEGAERAVKWIEEKFKLLPALSARMILLNAYVGAFYSDQKRWDIARSYWKRVVEAEPLIGNESELNMIKEANHNLAVTQPLAKTGGGCFVVTVCCGNTSAPEVTYLCAFRDEILRKHGTGRRLIQAYYCAGPYLAKVISGSKAEAFRLIIRKCVLRPVIFVLRHIWTEGHGIPVA